MRKSQHTGRALLALGLTFTAALGGACAVSTPDDNGGVAGIGVAGMALPTGGTGAVAGMASGGAGGTIAGTTGGTTAGTTGGTVAVTGGSGAVGGNSEFAGTTGGTMMVTGGTEAGTTGGTEMTTGGAGGMTGVPDCLAVTGGYSAMGPFTVTTATVGSVKMWVPEVPAGCKVPVIHLANGTGGSCSSYRAVHERIASYGMLETCYENGNTGAGTQGIMALEAAYTMFPDLAGDQIGSTGHSQGGQAAFIVLTFAEQKWGDAKIYAGLAMEPASGFGSQPAGGSWQSHYAKIKSPMFMFSGTADNLVSAGWVAQAMSALDPSIEAYNWSAIGATHVPVPTAATSEIAPVWFRWKLLGDNEACKAFKALPGAGNWNSTKEQNPVDCL